MIRHFVSDLDGTLLNGSAEWDDVIGRGIDKILQKGCSFTAATGRTANGVKSLKQLWELPVYLILLNGALILDCRRNVIFEQQVSDSAKEKLLRDYSNANLEFITKEGSMTMLSQEAFIREYSAWDFWKKKVLENKDRTYYKKYMDHISFGVSEEKIRKAHVLKVNGLLMNGSNYAKTLAEIEERLTDIVNAPFTDHVLEITAKGVSKANALLFLSDMLGWKKEETAVFGDGGNDIGMLKMFPNSYAPENASERVKQAAMAVTGCHAQYGVLNRMLELLGESGDISITNAR